MFKFDIDTMIDPVVKSAKTFTSMIVVKDVREAVNAVIDANAALTKTMYTECSKFAAKSA